MMNIDSDALSDVEVNLVQFLNLNHHELICPFLREHGRFFKPSLLPNGISEGSISVCYANSYRLLKQYGKTHHLVYVEGYAVHGYLMMPTLHAWCSDLNGKVYDPTWNNGLAYFGVAFKTTFVMSEIRKREKKGSLYFGFIDDWHQNWPVIRQLADRPKVWRYGWNQYKD